MKKIQTNQGAAALPIIIGVVVVLIIIGVAFTSNKGDSESVVIPVDRTEDTANNEEVGDNDSHDDQMMDDDKMKDGEMDKAPVAPQAGSYEEYSAEKVARADNGDVVLFFHASWCPTCRNQENNILKDLGNIPSNLTILKVDYDKEVELKKKYGITFQHTFVQVDAQGNVIASWAGGSSLNDVVKNLK